MGKECEEHVLGCLWTDDTTDRVPCSHCEGAAFFAFIATLVWLPFLVRVCMHASGRVAWYGAVWETPCAYLGPADRSMTMGLAPAVLLGMCVHVCRVERGAVGRAGPPVSLRVMFLHDWFRDDPACNDPCTSQG